MKSLILFIALTFTFSTIQSQEIEGTYANKWLANTGEGIEYTLTLNAEGTFTFNYTRMYKDEHPDTNVQVNGNWKMENHLLVLDTDITIEDDHKIAAGLNSNKARFVSVSPRNPNFNLVKPSLKFYASDVFYAKDMELIKTSSITASN